MNIWGWLMSLFHRRPASPPHPLMLPHPAEPINPAATVTTVNMRQVVEAWYSEWDVPDLAREFWDAVSITAVAGLTVLDNGVLRQVGALTWADEKKMEIDPRYAIPGVVAHEMGHISRYQLTAQQQANFSALYQQLMQTDPMLKLMYSQVQYVRDQFKVNQDVEGQAEVYRYLGAAMPALLKVYYPNLLVV